jgi:hypothetical protein
MDNQKLISKIMEKQELQKLPTEDVEMALALCAKKGNSDEENIERTRELLHGAYGAFSSRKLFVSRKERTPEWILKKHLSTRERLPHYNEIYKKIMKGFNGKINVIDLGSGVNGFSCLYFDELGLKVKYIGLEGIGQLVDLMNEYFKKQKLNAKAIHLSLFQLEKIKNLIKKERGKKVVFLFKVLDSLESLERDYSKKLLFEITPLSDKVVVSLATRSMISRKPFNVKRSWIVGFIEQEFKILDDFEIGGERYIVFERKKGK